MVIFCGKKFLYASDYRTEIRVLDVSYDKSYGVGFVGPEGTREDIWLVF